MILYGLTFVLSFLLAFYLTPIMREAALRFGIVDKPDGKLKKQREPVPYLGGLAIYLGFLGAIAFVYDFDRQVLGLLLSGTIMVLLGLIDDFGFLSPRIKLAGQLIAVWVLIKSGIYIKLIFLPKYHDVPVFAYALTALWLVGMTNAFNIIDVMDGLAATVASMAALVLFGVALWNHHLTIAVLTLALAGSLLGFLRYNRPPARIYMGDTGSLFIGLMLGSLAMIGSYTKYNGLAYLAPILILGVPIFDTFLVMFIRFWRGKPIMYGSPDHFALRLKMKGWSVPAIVITSGATTLILGAAAFWMMLMKSEIDAMILSGLFGLVGLAVAIWVGRVKVQYPEGEKEKNQQEAGG